MKSNELTADQMNRVRDSMHQWYFGDLSHEAFTAIQNKIQSEVTEREVFGNVTRPARQAYRTAAAGEQG